MFHLAGEQFNSRLILGTAAYPSPEIMVDAIKQSKTEIITVALRREAQGEKNNYFWDIIKKLNLKILPNTSGCFNAKQAVLIAKMAREIFETHWIKLEIFGSEYTLQPDPFELLIAAEQLISEGFEVFPYCTEDLILCQRLVGVGCKILMPWGSPIGSAQGILNEFQLKILREQLPQATIILDAGIGRPSDATKALEIGCDAVLLDSAVALARDPISMANAFNQAVKAGRQAYQAGILPKRDFATPTSPVIGAPFWPQNSEIL